MGAIRPPKPVKLFAGLLAGSEALFVDARTILERKFGPVDLVSPAWPFTATDYYRDELGETVSRQFVFFENLVEPACLPDVKIRTNQIEQDIGVGHHRPAGQRPVNIDPGYLTLSRLVLATTKDYSHRLYLRDGIYAEVTLRYHAHRWEPLPWTYADYAAETYQKFFETARSRLKQQLGHSR
jgi:hypothetical protein